jgi:O-antigen/teichoic acid export membrane protein
MPDLESNSQRNKRIAKNTLLLYFRMLITMGVSLYTVRVVLDSLGVEDFGLYNVIGGVVALLSFLPNSMASATQRFFSHALGQQDQDKLNRIFGVNVLLYLGIGIIAFVLLKTGGLWFVQNHLQVPEDRYEAIVTLFSIAVVTFVVTVLKSPLMAIIIAHEDMKIYAYMAIVDALLKLGVVFLLVQLPGDKIVVYGFLLLGVALLDTTVYLLICFRKYTECRLQHIRWDTGLAKEVVGFTGWTLFGQLTTVARTAAVTILLNQYFSPVVVAARAIANNIAGQCQMLSTQFNTSLYPPIIKAYAAEKREEMYGLVINGAKATFFLMWILALPIYIEMPAILALWLTTVPEYTVEFARLTLIEGLIFAISIPVATAARAPGRMAAYESILGALQISILIVSWFLLKAGYGPQSVYFTAIAVNLIMFIVRLLIVGRLTGLPVIKFLKDTTPPIFAVVAVSYVFSAGLAGNLPGGVGFTIIGLSASFILTSIVIFLIGLPKTLQKQLVCFAQGKIRLLYSTK